MIPASRGERWIVFKGPHPAPPAGQLGRVDSVGGEDHGSTDLPSAKEHKNLLLILQLNAGKLPAGTIRSMGAAIPWLLGSDRKSVV